jgi:hypothetical protein
MDKPIVKNATGARQGMTDAVIWVLISGLTLVTIAFLAMMH